MFRVEFSLVHRGCLVNEVSRAFPDIRFICPGGFIEGSSAEEVIVLDNPDEDRVQQVMEYLEASPKVVETELLERTTDRAFVRFVTGSLPEAFCSKVVEKHHGFRLGMEIQEGGVEIWRVGCAKREQAEELLEELKSLGEVKQSSISETSWEEMMG